MLLRHAEWTSKDNKRYMINSVFHWTRACSNHQIKFGRFCLVTINKPERVFKDL